MEKRSQSIAERPFSHTPNPQHPRGSPVAPPTIAAARQYVEFLIFLLEFREGLHNRADRDTLAEMGSWYEELLPAWLVMKTLRKRDVTDVEFEKPPQTVSFNEAWRWLEELRGELTDGERFAQADQSTDASATPTGRKRATKQETRGKVMAAILHKIQNPGASEKDCATAVEIAQTTLHGNAEWQSWSAGVESAQSNGTLEELKREWDSRSGDYIVGESVDS